MSTVFIVALLHGVPVFYLGVRSRNRFVLTVLAFIAAGVALSTGNARYNGTDLAAVFIAWILGMLVLKADAPTHQVDENERRKKSEERKGTLFRSLFIISAGIVTIGGLIAGLAMYAESQGPCSEAELRKNGLTQDQCKINDQYRRCREGSREDCQKIEARNARPSESTDQAYRW